MFDSGIKAQGAESRASCTGAMARATRASIAAVTRYVYALDARDRQADPDVRQRRPDRSASAIRTRSRAAVRRAHLAGRRPQGSADPRRPVSEGLPASPGDVRAYDARTGKLQWSFHTIPHPGEKGYETWSKDSWRENGGANNWPGMALDAARGIVYVPTGSAAATSTAPTGSATTSTRTRCWRSTPTPENSSGTSSSCVTTSGIAIRRRRRA